MKNVKNIKTLIRLWILCPVFLLLPLSLLLSCNGKELPSFSASKGTIDLRGQSLVGRDVISLDGQWGFYWNQLLEPKDFVGKKPERTGFITNPTVWNGYRAGDEKLPGEGYATYRLTIKNCRPGSYGLKIGTMATAYRLWINERLLAANGRVGMSRKAMRPQQLPQVIFFDVKEEGLSDVSLLIQVSNYYSDKGGIWSHIYFGSHDRILQKREFSVALELFIFGVIFIMSLYHFTLYLFRRKEESALYFALTCLALAARTLFTGEFFIVRIFPSINWELQLKIEFLTFYAGFPVFMMFFQYLYREEYSRLILKILQGVGLVCSCMVLLFPVRIYSATIIPYHVVVVFGSLYLVFVILKALIHRREGAVAIFGGILVLVVAVINDMLDANNIINTGYILPHALIFFIFSQSIILSKMFSSAFSDVERLTENLKISHRRIEDYKYNLEIKIEERTRELAAANEKLKDLDRAKTNFFANISHEFRTPLTLMLAPVDEALSRKKEIDENSLVLIKRSGEELLTLINDLLDMSRLEAGRMKLEVAEIDMAEYLKKYCSAMESVMSMKSISLVFSFPSHPSLLWIDIEKMNRIMANLFSNSLKFTEEGGRIRIDVTCENNAMQIRFEDSGCGISSEQTGRVFERFFQADGGSTRSYEGTGIGLAIIKEYVELHGGSISVESRYIDDFPDNHGTVFKLSFPLGRDHFHGRDDVMIFEGSSNNIFDINISSGPGFLGREEARSFEEVKTSPSEKDFKVLVVEDNRDMRAFLVRLLEDDYEVISASNGREARDILVSTEDIDCVVSDVMMPEMDGYELLQYMRKDEKYAGVPVVLLTARAADEMKHEGLLAGATDYVTKPFNAEELKLRLKNQLEMKGLRDRLARRNRRLYEKLRESGKVRGVAVTEETEKKLKTVCDFIKENFHEDLTRDGLAAAVDINSDHFSRVFNQYSGKKLNDYVNELRIEKAKILLSQTDENITRIAHDVGFESLRTFNRVFRKMTSMTPGEFRVRNVN